MIAAATAGNHHQDRRTPSSATIAASRQSSIGYSWLARTRKTKAAGTSCSSTSAARPAPSTCVAAARRAISTRHTRAAAMPTA